MGGMTGEDGSPVPYSHEERRATEEVYPGLHHLKAVQPSMPSLNGHPTIDTII